MKERVSLLVEIPYLLGEKLKRIPREYWESFVTKAFEDAVNKYVRMHKPPENKDGAIRRHNQQECSLFGDSKDSIEYTSKAKSQPSSIKFKSKATPIEPKETVEKPDVSNLEKDKSEFYSPEEVMSVINQLIKRCPISRQEVTDKSKTEKKYAGPDITDEKLLSDMYKPLLIVAGMREEDMPEDVKNVVNVLLSRGEISSVLAYLNFCIQSGLFD